MALLGRPGRFCGTVLKCGGGSAPGLCVIVVVLGSLRGADLLLPATALLPLDPALLAVLVLVVPFLFKVDCVKKTVVRRLSIQFDLEIFFQV